MGIGKGIGIGTGIGIGIGTGIGIEIGREDHRTLWRRVPSELAAAAGAARVCTCVCVRVRDAAQWCVVRLEAALLTVLSASTGGALCFGKAGAVQAYAPVSVIGMG